ncbi:MAG TPA: hypothetical protein DEH25_07880 [Chloroflexi bacterium]|nr:hypothetical protein [Chloroflexota bacterium]
MNSYQSVILNLKLLRRAFRRTQAALRFGSLENSPILFANSFPKSGTHLLTQVLQGFIRLAPVVDSGLPAVVTFAGSTGQPRPLEAILTDLHRFLPGDIGYGHLHALPELTAELANDRVCAFFILRDPRDVVVSHVHYVTEMAPHHVHHHYYAHELKSFDERLTASIVGRPGLAIPFPDISGRFEPYLGWFDCSEVLILRFEDFVFQRAATLERVLDHAQSRGLLVKPPRDEALRLLGASINPEKSPTFRSGKIGKWRESFSEAHRSTFKNIAGDLLTWLGYEDGDDW